LYICIDLYFVDILVKILFFGDIMGKPGRQGLIKMLPSFKLKYDADFIIANGENLSHGAGISRGAYNEMMDGGVDFLTGGNHIWGKKEVIDILNEKKSKIIRPANYPPGAPGEGCKIIEVGIYKVLVVNLIGRVFIKQDFDCPFRKIDEILSDDDLSDVKIKIVDFHAEATSEKIAFSYYVDGRVSAVIGTHTHVATNDARILPNGTFHITDVGMVGVKESILGKGKEEIIEEFLTQRPVKTDIADGNITHISGIFLDMDYNTGKVETFEKIEEDAVI
jgi:2',3'-cyclic-nucleotide 2'-phosphodiesterase